MKDIFVCETYGCTVSAYMVLRANVYFGMKVQTGSRRDLKKMWSELVRWIELA
jgi:hypothetical protein